ncbi:ArsR/SmtB family transcription factor [Paramicrobacterium fandaimingii]|uniref:ArsR/SmtB family transcription factor n=1 Tax=Paramicrobacterium fandaimingii TaxID=2708079 RepID=UPI00141F0D8D|nr:metalloregulator ArsR/SmtB family transcription factor [Microbacterium fandaimingii]
MTTREAVPVEVLDDGCCTSADAAVDIETARELAHVFKALSDPARVQLLALVAAHTEGEACVCDLIAPVGLSQPTVSHHLKVLVEGGLLSREQRGKWAYYRLVDSSMPELMRKLSTVVAIL